MKKILLSLAFLCAATSASALEAPSSGLRLGLNISNLSGRGFPSESREGLYIGVFHEFFMARQLSMMVDFGYSQQGAFAGVYGFKFNYISLSPLLKLYLVESTLSLNVGLQAACLFSSNTPESSIPGGNDSWSTGIGAQGYDIGPAVGMSVRVGPSRKFEFGVRYFEGKREQYEHLTNSVTTLSLGMRF